DFFLFSYGVVVSWGINREDCLSWVKQIASFEEQPYQEFESDAFTFFYGSQAKIHDDEICLSDREPLAKLAISYAIAQSVKLETFETSIQKTFNNTTHLPEDLAKKGRIFLSRREIRRITGQLFIERSSINLHLDVLDTPEIFWEFPEIEPLYKMASVYLDIDTRVEILNQRLDVLHELLEMLGNELNHQHSSRLEWTIILLIVIEVFLTLSKDIFKWT
ncbi:MAG: RMD1 family protein, partial [Parachlamydiaceae bacterium]